MLTRQSSKSNRLKTMAEEQQSGNRYASTEKKDNTGVHVKEIVDKECLAGEVYMSCKEVRGARSAKNSEIPPEKDQKKQNRDQEMHAVDSIKGSTERNNGAKRKRGRPKLSEKQIGERSTGADMDMKDSCVGDEAKSSAENDFVMSTTGDEISKNGDFQPSSKKPIVMRYARKLRSGVHRHNGVLSKTANTPQLENQAGETVLSERVDRPKDSVSNGHGESSKTVESESQDQDCHEIDHAKCDNMMTDEVGDTNDDQPLSMCLNILPPIGSDDSRAFPVGRQDGSGTHPLNQENTIESSPLQKMDDHGYLFVENTNQCAASNDKGGGLGRPAIVSIDTVENKESLPFVKRSLVWGYIDSMETYMNMTPKPHFDPLYDHMEESREGLAIGHIINFINLVEDTLKLQFSSDIAVIERSRKTFAEFKSHGFDVEKFEACLTQLLSEKQRADEVEKEYYDISSTISDIVDKGKLVEEISRLREEIKEIEKKLGEVRSKAEALSALKSKRDAVAEKLQSHQLKFESIVGSLSGK